ncbi:helix-turn-helix domain-containing protein [Oceanirhabdus seepicola]|uniref:Helix-turn-helix transcriptional regulator n=1 Tax=Oceanirhabdus seepicola TaxID=2828781 RepID=A0A9J6P9Q8_9CLOT|nr:helix-turn-helix transcriptional regulator [Oceanirhabdus seepicola]MCM1992796.1 helix-turn-helix transcriptional regulator [Oceanirhabdus seepicola]
MVINLYNSLYSHLQEDTLGKRIKKGRMVLGLSQSDLCELINIGRRTIDEYENDKVIPSRDVMFKLCIFLGKDLIIGDDEYLKFIINDYSKMLFEWRIKN